MDAFQKILDYEATGKTIVTKFCFGCFYRQFFSWQTSKCSNFIYYTHIRCL